MRNRVRLIRVRWAVGAAIAVVFAAVAVLAFADVATTARSCSTKGRVLVQTTTGRITSVPGDGFRIWYACWNRTGRRAFLGVHDPTGSEQLGHPRLAGSYAAIERFRPSTVTTGPTVVLVDLAHRKRVETDVPNDVTGMVLSQRGDLVVSSPESVLHLRRGNPPVTLDTGDIVRNTLALSPNGRYAYWQNAGQTRSFDLRELRSPAYSR